MMDIFCIVSYAKRMNVHIIFNINYLLNNCILLSSLTVIPLEILKPWSNLNELLQFLHLFDETMELSISQDKVLLNQLHAKNWYKKIALSPPTWLHSPNVPQESSLMENEMATLIKGPLISIHRLGNTLVQMVSY